MATSGNISTVISQSSQMKITARLKWSRKSYSVKFNTSTIDWVYQLEFEGIGAYNDSSKARAYTVSINRNTYTGTVDLNVTGNKTLVAQKGTLEIEHNDDGTISVPMYFTQKHPKGLNNELTATVYDSFDLDPIPRPATATSATHFTDEENPVIYYSNPYGEIVDSLQACISLTGASDNIAAYRDIPKTDTSYTFELTDAEREALIAAMGENTVINVRFYVKTTIENVTFWDYKTVTASLVNYMPTLSPNVFDMNDRTFALTGNRNTIIKYYSNISFNSGAVAHKGATIDSQYVINGSQNISHNGSGIIYGADSNTFYFSVTDSKGRTTRQAKTLTMIPYFKLTNSLSTEPLTASGSLTFTISGKYFNGSFGAGNNELEVEFYIKDLSTGEPVFNASGSGWVVLGVVTPEVDGEGNYTYSNTITGLDYEGSYELTVNAIDLLTPVQSVTTVISAIPVFDWGKNDFRHNTHITVAHNKSIFGTKSDGEPVVAFEPSDAAGNTIVGYGNYALSDGDTNIYGNNVNLYAKNSIKLNHHAVTANNKAIRGTTTTGAVVSALEPCDSSNNLVIGAGGYSRSLGTTKIQGNNISLEAKGTININGREYGTNKVLWNGGAVGSHMNGNQTISLSEKISAQPNGIVLVFSAYEPSTGYALNVGWSTHFVPKYMPIINDGGGQSFLMGLNAGFSLIGAKYLYIYDDSITGHAGNTSTGTNSGISFGNNEFVLRYVIGV